MRDVQLLDTDPTIFARCDKCARHWNGRQFGSYFGKAYTALKWKRNPTCDNCGGPMTAVRTIKVEG